MLKLGTSTISPGVPSDRSSLGFFLLGLDLGLFQGASIEFGLFLAGLEATMSEFGGGVDEFQSHLLQSLENTRDFSEEMRR